MAAESALFETQRKRVLALYQKAGQPFRAGTKPYKSTRALRFRIAEDDVAGAPPHAFLIADGQQELEFYDYGVGDSITQGLDGLANVGNAKTASRGDTNLSKGHSTNGAEDFIIEGIGAGGRGVRINYDDASIAAFGVPIVGGDPAALGMLRGTAYHVDPAALFVPPQLHSPFNLEAVLYQAVAPHLSVEFEWDEEHVVKIGTLDELPQAGAASFLRANGDPRNDNRYRIPEGYVWRRDGQADSEFVVRVRLQETVAIPINLTTSPVAGGAPQVPRRVVLDIATRLYGLSVKIPSQN
jgi:hypothetical protein